ncbi:MAG TPA: phosphotransferase [Microlunatus sp.]|nr:phosphotransferase [Microlunatus sp.]
MPSDQHAPPAPHAHETHTGPPELASAPRTALRSDEPPGRGPHEDLSGQLLNAISRARWFAGKGRRAELTGHTRLGWLTELDRWPAVRLEVVEISYRPDEDPELELDEAAETPYELYQLAVSYRPAPAPELAHAELGRTVDPDLGRVVAYDAAQDPDACRLLLEELVAGRRVREPESEVRFRPSGIEGLSAQVEPQPFRGQQSNTSIMFGEVAMLKLFRRLELGTNLDIETHDALNRAGVEGVAKLYGWIDASWRHRGADVHADLAMLVEKLTGAEDGWGLALDALRDGRPFIDDAARLGRALAEIHTALRGSFPTARGSGAATATVMADRFAVARAIAPALNAYAGGVLATLDALAAVELDLQRVHGDFHLGQTLRTPSGWKIIDFEGEPAKTLAERLAPDSVWRDIAGMLRSFDYAGASVPGPGAASWVADCRSAFLDAYAGGELDAADAAVLRAYEVDKAVYEVVYEVRNRPDWVHIPLGAVAALSGHVPGQQPGSGTEPGTDQSHPTGVKE